MSPPLRLLFVDDEETFRRSTTDLLKQHGFLCDAAADAAEALAMLNRQDYDLVIADIKMPGNADLEFVRQVAERGDGVPIILMTGYPSVASAIKSIELPVVAYLVKPFDFATLVEKVRAATRRIELLRTMRDEVSRLADCRQTLEQADQHLRDQPRADHSASLQAFVSLTVRNIADSLSSLQAVVKEGEAMPPEPHIQQWTSGSHSDMRRVLRDVVATLERTKSAFKSKELGDLRRRLESMLDA